MGYEVLDVKPMTRRIGAEVFGLDLGKPLSNRQTAELREALANHQVLFFRDQHLSLDEQKRLTEVYGPLNRVPYVAPLPDDPDVIAVLKEADEVNV